MLHKAYSVLNSCENVGIISIMKDQLQFDFEMGSVVKVKKGKINTNSLMEAVAAGIWVVFIGFAAYLVITVIV